VIVPIGENHLAPPSRGAFFVVDFWGIKAPAGWQASQRLGHPFAILKTCRGPRAYRGDAQAFYRVCEALMLSGNVEDPMTELVASKIVAFAKAGELDPNRLCSRVVLEWGNAEGPSSGEVVELRPKGSPHHGGNSSRCDPPLSPQRTDRPNSGMGRSFQWRRFDPI
jgi:hypothetical protein